MTEPVVSTSEEHDYTKGEARRHHQFYISSGDIVIQVQNAIFKVHLHFLAQYSSVLAGLIDIPKSDQDQGTEMMPLKLQGDDVRGWEVLLGCFYRENHFMAYSPSWDEALRLWPIAHKYGMTSLLEMVELRIRKETKNMPRAISVMELARRLDRSEMALHAFSAARRDRTAQYPTFEDVQRMGIFHFYYMVRFDAGHCTHCGHRELAVCALCRAPRRAWPSMEKTSVSWRV